MNSSTAIASLDSKSGSHISKVEGLVTGDGRKVYQFNATGRPFIDGMQNTDNIMDARQLVEEYNKGYISVLESTRK